jgi:4-hydroxybenzoate polyprenyltransferase
MLSDYLRLVRFPLLFTALADPIAGYCLAMPGADIRLQGLLPVLLASAALYAAGMVFNDCADIVRDRSLHPDRPLASGRVAFAPAFAFGVLLGLVALVAAQAVSLKTGAVALGLALGVLLYNGLTKRSAALGALTMGALRAGNVFLGFVAAFPDRAPVPWLSVTYLGLVFLYVAFLTLLSTLEEPPARPGRFAALVALMALAVVSVNLVLPVPFSEGGWLALVLTLLLAVALLARGLGAVREFDPGQVSTMVKIGILGIIPLDAAAVAGTGSVTVSTVVLLLLIPPVAFITGFVRMPGLDRAN